MPKSKRGIVGAEAIAYRGEQLKELTNEIGVYALCDLDHIPIYVGQSVDGIKARVRRHLTSARSDVIANRQLDVWEIASVLAWPVANKSEITAFETQLFHHFNDQSPLMNGSIPGRLAESFVAPEPSQTIYVLPDEETDRRRKPDVRLPRQISHYLRLVDHYLNVKNSKELQLALDVHFERLKKYHGHFLE